MDQGIVFILWCIGDVSVGHDGACPTNVPQKGANGARKCNECKVCNGKNLRKNAKVLIDKDPGIRFPS